ncbi:ATP-dependent nuclease [Bradyrhizobium yuanmingense]|uniref:Endonuclease GajA/Old nuclease/RecF-like AAA domain-containing protein n=1 Tax=Bradyrhizobium yuanmingense TaxID=108015 RepID=A0ABV4GJD1_9BRAD|nr:AAA family ATPase [Bradyrhizobium yuanmingense]
MQTSAAHATFDRTLCEAVSIVVLSMTLPIPSPSIILSANSMFRVLPLIPLNKRGSGIKRLVLLNFFRAKAERAAIEKQAGSVIYAIEEPETSQHPRNQRMLMSALSDLSATAGRQVFVTTHTPMLARGLPDASLRFIERQPDGSRSIATGGPDTNARIAQSLGVLPDHSVKLFVGVEGKRETFAYYGAAMYMASKCRATVGRRDGAGDLDQGQAASPQFTDRVRDSAHLQPELGSLQRAQRF